MLVRGHPNIGGNSDLFSFCFGGSPCHDESPNCDVRAVVLDVLRHRIGITYEAEAENITSENIINKIVNVIEVP